MQPTLIDFGAAAGRADLRSLIEDALGPPSRSRKWRCPFHDDHNPSLGLTPDGRRFRCWSCGATGTALDWTMWRDGSSLVEAARKLDPSINPAGRPARPSSGRGPRPVTPAAPRPDLRVTAAPQPWHAADWQEAVEAIVRRAESVLWSRDGRDALAWLRARGIEDHTITRFRLGFLAEFMTSPPIASLLGKDGRPRVIGAQRGIVIPWVAPESWYARPLTEGDEVPALRWVGANVRRLMPDVFGPWVGPDKCRALDGSSRGYAYPWPDLAPGVPCLIVEGELDALVAIQDVGHMANVVTVGGAKQAPRPESLAALATATLWLIATDHDAAGDADVQKWRSLSPRKARRLYLPHGKDIGEFRQGGGDLAAWLEGEFRRLGL